VEAQNGWDGGLQLGGLEPEKSSCAGAAQVLKLVQGQMKSHLISEDFSLSRINKKS
jgi:hypothetical protein